VTSSGVARHLPKQTGSILFGVAQSRKVLHDICKNPLLCQWTYLLAAEMGQSVRAGGRSLKENWSRFFKTVLVVIYKQNSKIVYFYKFVSINFHESKVQLNEIISR
jgi:hypothetical protein